MRGVVGLWLRQPELLTAERAARPLVFVDELQDTDPAQVELLRLLAGDGRDLVAVGDPDQSIYGFRGADVTGIRDFPTTFPTAAGEPAPVLSLTTCRRSGPTLLAASRRVARHLGGPVGHRRLVAAEGLAAGQVSVALLRSEAQEAAHVAARLRHAHLVDRVPWSRMAVLVRSTVHALPVLRRAMVAAGVPVAVSGDDVPLTQEPAVRPLLRLLGLRHPARDPRRGRRRRAGDLAAGRRRRHGAAPAAAGAAPLRARRGWCPGVRAAARRGARRPDPPGGPGRRGDPPRPGRCDAAGPRAGRGRREPGATAETVLWDVWSATGLAQRWERASLEGGHVGEAADRDLDAVVALFEAAARFCDRLPAAGPEVFLDHLLGQQIPGDDLAGRVPGRGRGAGPDRACAPRASSGTSSASPGSRRASGPTCGCAARSSARSGWSTCCGRAPSAPPTQVATAATLARLLDEERRLFYVAATRARVSLSVLGVSSEREGLAPSRFLDEIDPLPADLDARPVSSVRRPLSLTGLVADLRQVACDPGSPRRAPDRRRRPPRGPGRGGGARCRPRGLVGASRACPTSARSATPTSPCRSARRRSSRSSAASCGGSSSTSAAATPRAPRRASAPSCTRWPRRRSTQGAAPRRRCSPGCTSCCPRSSSAAAGSPARSAPRPRPWSGGWPPGSRGHRREVVATELEFSAAVDRAVLGGRIDRLERDDLGQRGCRRPQDRVEQAARRRDRRPRAARHLPAGRRARRVRRARRHEQRGRRAAAGRQGRRREASGPGPARARRLRRPRLGPRAWCSRSPRAWPARRSVRSRTATARCARCARAAPCRTRADR